MTDTRLLEIDDLSVTFDTPSGEVQAVSNVSISIGRGETIALVGESGSGKSVTALSVMQLLPYPRAKHPGGSITFRDEELISAPAEVLRRIRGDQIGMIFQEPMTSLNPLHTVEKQISETLKLHKGLSDDKARARCLELLDMVRIRDPEKRLDSYPHQLSGGQRQRVMIAMALANEPDLLIADEPTTAVDVTTQAQILKLLRDLKDEFGLSVMLITHDLGIVEKVSDRIYVMKDGRIVESGDTREVFAAPSETYTQDLLAAEPRQKPTRDVSSNPIILEAEHVRVWFPIQKGILKRTVDYIKAADDISFQLRTGETVGVVGESGSGKTTLALGLLRLISARGTIRFDGEDIQSLKGDELKPLRRQMQVVFQDPYGSLSPRLSIHQIIEEGLKAHDIGDEQEREARVIAALEEVGLDPASRYRYPHEFSGGQRQRVAIARAIIMQPRLVVLDEPTSALDRSVQVQIVDLLLNLQSEHQLAYLFISHDLKIVRAMSDQLIVMRDGQVVEQGAAESVFESPQDPYTHALISAAFDLEVTDEDAVRQ
ncbi:MAG: ABC transporter ATP-binding protein [marine bacterium B5-7]|nr:MAG: ABC transporter ATP-binding protein [marine bacterium B5-7]